MVLIADLLVPEQLPGTLVVSSLMLRRPHGVRLLDLAERSRVVIARLREKSEISFVDPLVDVFGLVSQARPK